MPNRLTSRLSVVGFLGCHGAGASRRRRVRDRHPREGSEAGDAPDRHNIGVSTPASTTVPAPTGQLCGEGKGLMRDFARPTASSSRAARSRVHREDELPLLQTLYGAARQPACRVMPTPSACARSSRTRRLRAIHSPTTSSSIRRCRRRRGESPRMESPSRPTQVGHRPTRRRIESAPRVWPSIALLIIAPGSTPTHRAQAGAAPPVPIVPLRGIPLIRPERRHLVKTLIYLAYPDFRSRRALHEHRALRRRADRTRMAFAREGYDSPGG